ncbi:MAG TPA: hypothetical protein G4N96_00395 [Chloroflexi bacterium]|nr:hypothetical protein [Chloroflexota bacterium]
MKHLTILTVDIGTSALKAVLYSADGSVLALSAQPYRYQTPQPGWAEARPTDWWDALTAALAELQVAGFDLQRAQAIGLTGQMHTAVLLDKAGRVLQPTILWLDRRAAAESVELQARLNLPPDQFNSTYTLPKLLWLARHRPEVLAQTHALLWPKDYLRYRLTGQLLTDVTDAAGAGLLNWNTRNWDIERLELTGLSAAVLPALRQAGDDAGALKPSVAAELGLAPQAKVIVGAGDVIALMGASPPKVGRFSASLGSSGMISSLIPASLAVDDPQRRMYVYPFLPYRLLNGVLSSSGASLDWARRAFYDDKAPLSPEEATAAASSVAPGAEGLFFLPFLNGERSPYWNDALRGGFYGLSFRHNRAHILRAVMEGVAYSLRHLIEISQDLGASVQEIALSGGAAGSVFWAQLIADVRQRPLLIFGGQESVTRPLYAYCITALNVNDSFDAALRRTFDRPLRLEPRLELATIYAKGYHRYRLLADFAAERLS